MVNIVIALSPNLPASAFYTSNDDPNQQAHDLGDGPPWNADLAPGGYIVTATVTGADGTDVTVTVANSDDDNTVLATKTKTLKAKVPGQQVTDNIDVRFTVPAALMAKKGTSKPAKPRAGGKNRR